MTRSSLRTTVVTNSLRGGICLSETKCSDALMAAIETLKQIVQDLEGCCGEIYQGPGDLCDLAGTRIEEFGRKLNREIYFFEKLAEGAKVLEEKI